jgi:hypothetical protein
MGYGVWGMEFCFGGVFMFVMMMFGDVIVVVMMMMVVAIIVIMVVVVMGGIVVFNGYYGVGAADAATCVAGEIEVPALNIQFVELFCQFGFVNAQIDKGSKGHVAGDAGETVEVQHFHASCFSNALLRLPIL